LHRDETDAGAPRLRNYRGVFGRAGRGKGAQRGFRSAHQRYRVAGSQRLRFNALSAQHQTVARNCAQWFWNRTRRERSSRRRFLRAPHETDQLRTAGKSNSKLARVIIWTAATRRQSSTCVSLTISALYSRELVRALQTRTLAAAVRCRLVLALRGFFQFARKLFHALAHDLARFKFHCRPRWNH